MSYQLPNSPIRQDRPSQTPTNYEVQTRGPVHEAFLEPTDTLPQPRAVRQPPPGEILELEARLEESSDHAAELLVETRRGSRLLGSARVKFVSEGPP